jgi:conjugative relaxase-like TrwC/TraI family protein
VAPKITRDKESGERIETHRAGNDCTFSAPKSASIAYVAGVEGIKEAHDAAVVSVLGHMEEHYSHYRSPEGIKDGGLVAAKFDHATSRNIDPQLHSHVFDINAVHAPDGAWKANEPKAIFQDQKSLGLLYRQELARELQAGGFEIVVRDRSQMFFELKGIDPALIEHFSSRREAIEQQVVLWKEEGKFTGVPHARLFEMGVDLLGRLANQVISA